MFVETPKSEFLSFGAIRSIFQIGFFFLIGTIFAYKPAECVSYSGNILSFFAFKIIQTRVAERNHF